MHRNRAVKSGSIGRHPQHDGVQPKRDTPPQLPIPTDKTRPSAQPDFFVAGPSALVGIEAASIACCAALVDDRSTTFRLDLERRATRQTSGNSKQKSLRQRAEIFFSQFVDNPMTRAILRALVRPDRFTVSGEAIADSQKVDGM
jgi:hypothetical protein